MTKHKHVSKNDRQTGHLCQTHPLQAHGTRELGVGQAGILKKPVLAAPFHRLAKPMIYREHMAENARSDPALTNYYDSNTIAFIATTRDVDMSFARGRFLAAVPSTPDGPACILDAGSGSGRDALAFRVLGFDVRAFDASARGTYQAETWSSPRFADGACTLNAPPVSTEYRLTRHAPR